MAAGLAFTLMSAASAGAATQAWTFALAGLNIMEGSDAELWVTNVSSGPATVSFSVAAGSEKDETIGANSSSYVTSACPGPAGCYAGSVVTSSTPDLQLTLTLQLSGNTDATVLTQNDYALVGPSGGEDDVLGNVTTGLGALQTTTSALESDFGPVPPQLMSVTTTIATLEHQVSTLTADVTKLTKLLKPKKTKKRKKAKKKHR
jgi:hypothetical protein